MTAQPRELALLSRAQRALAQARTIDEIKDVRDKAQLAKTYAKKKRLAHKIVLDASAIYVQAKRKLGQSLRKIPLAKASPGNQLAHEGPP